MTTPQPKGNPVLRLIRNWRPRQVFRADAFGALLSTVLLGFVLPRFESYLGMPTDKLYLLASIAAVLFIYSLSIYWMKPRKWLSYLRIIALANASYCIFTLTLLYQLREQLPPLAFAYFIAEALLIFSIAFTEWSYANRYAERKF